MEQINNEQVITYEQIIAGALLKFSSIDNIDFSLLVSEIEKKENIKVEGVWYDLPQIGEFLNHENEGLFEFGADYSLGFFIEHENQSLENKLKSVAGDIVNRFFDNLDTDKFKEKKMFSRYESKRSVLEDANILLISDSYEDYNELLKYGFKNVDWCRSIIKADIYFDEYPERLKKYHIIIRGNQNVLNCTFDKAVTLENKIYRLERRNHILDVHLVKDYQDGFVASLKDYKNDKSFRARGLTHSRIFDHIIDYTFINDILNTAIIENENAPELVDYVNPNKLTLPKRKQDLKILYLGSCAEKEKISKELGLNIEFYEDNDSALARHVIKNLGNYDIIIVSERYSSSILGMNLECTEQCKDTGRRLTLLATYHTDLLPEIDEDGKTDLFGFGSRIELKYVFAGEEAPTIYRGEKSFSVLRGNYSTHYDNDWRAKYEQDKYDCTEGIISSTVSLYNERLNNLSYSALEDFDLKSEEIYNDEFYSFREIEDEKRYQNLKPIYDFDMFRKLIFTYLDLKNKGKVKQLPADLKIIESDDGVVVKQYLHDRLLGTIAFSKNCDNGNLRVFTIQCFTKKKVMSSPQTIGLYTSKYELLDDIPNKPDQYQAQALSGIEKKVVSVLTPMIMGAYESGNNDEAIQYTYKNTSN